MSTLKDQSLGYYTVGNKKYASKIDACIEGSRQGVHPEWHFHDRVWHTVDWTVEPQLDILEMYKLRARQVREKYDHVILAYSGGSDSQTMVNAFLASGCHIDEVLTIWNRAHTSVVDTSGMIIHAANVESEFELATRPGLDRLLNQSPKTKITYIDVSPHIIKNFESFDEEEWLSVTPEHLNPQIITRWSVARDTMQLNQLDKGKKTVVLYAIDKPRVCLKDGYYCVYFLDSIVNMVRGGHNRSGYDNIQAEFFYWSPDMPQLVVKQAHMIKTWFENHPRLQTVLSWPNVDFAKRSAYEIVTRSIIYPEWDMSTYQCLKPSSCVWSEWDYWFFENHKESRAYHHWTKGIENIQHRIDKKYLAFNFQGRFEGFVGMINGHFLLDKIDSRH